jgi:hypothetical protein
MNIINILISIICIFFAAILSFISPNNKLIKGSKESNIDKAIYNYSIYETDKLVKGSNESNIDKAIYNYSIYETDKLVKGSNESNIDKAIYNYSIDETDKLVKGSKEPLTNKNKKNNSKRIGGDYKNKHNKKTWYRNSWNDVFNNDKLFNDYSTDKYKSFDYIYFDWQDVMNDIKPYIYNNKNESMGVLRSNENKLYIYDIDTSSSINSSESYAASVSKEIADKYNDIPGEFIFHTHPNSENIIPFPSDVDIYLSLIHSYEAKYIGDVVFCIFGAIIYFIDPNKLNNLIKDGGLLNYLNYCYDLINAWNAYNNYSSSHTYTDHVNFLKQWGYNMIIIPSDYYIALNYNKNVGSYKNPDKFSKTKYNLVETIKEYIIELENKEKRKK